MATAEHYWTLIHSERRRLVELLDGLPADAWREQSLCETWTVEHVVAHLTAGARTGTVAWIRSMLFAGFRPAVHNDRRLREYLGRSPRETLEHFLEAVPTTVAPSSAYVAMLGENIVHGQDIARPLGLSLSPDPGRVACGAVLCE